MTRQDWTPTTTRAVLGYYQTEARAAAMTAVYYARKPASIARSWDRENDKRAYRHARRSAHLMRVRAAIMDAQP